MSGKVVHFEVPADNVDRARKFYRDTFQWKLNVMPQFDYTMVETTPAGPDGMPVGGINGGLAKRGAPISHPVITIEVAAIDAATKAIVKNGGKVVRGREPVGDMGFAAYFTDPEGNVIGLWENAKE